VFTVNPSDYLLVLDDSNGKTKAKDQPFRVTVRHFDWASSDKPLIDELISWGAAQWKGSDHDHSVNCRRSLHCSPNLEGILNSIGQSKSIRYDYLMFRDQAETAEWKNIIKTQMPAVNSAEWRELWPLEKDPQTIAVLRSIYDTSNIIEKNGLTDKKRIVFIMDSMTFSNSVPNKNLDLYPTLEANLGDTGKEVLVVAARRGLIAQKYPHLAAMINFVDGELWLYQRSSTTKLLNGKTLDEMGNEYRNLTHTEEKEKYSFDVQIIEDSFKSDAAKSSGTDQLNRAILKYLKWFLDMKHKKRIVIQGNV